MHMHGYIHAWKKSLHDPPLERYARSRSRREAGRPASKPPAGIRLGQQTENVGSSQNQFCLWKLATCSHMGLIPQCLTKDCCIYVPVHLTLYIYIWLPYSWLQHVRGMYAPLAACPCKLRYPSPSGRQSAQATIEVVTALRRRGKAYQNHSDVQAVHICMQKQACMEV